METENDIKRAGGIILASKYYETTLTPLCGGSIRGKTGEMLPQLLDYIKVKVQRGKLST